MRAGLIENVHTETTENHVQDHKENVPPLRLPKDKYFLCHILFFLLGVVHMMPMSFFTAANNFWMYKFRNLSDPTMSAGNRTYLGTHFASTLSIVNSIPPFFFGMWNAMYGYKYKIMNRINITLFFEVLVFYVLTAFVKIDTDDYQTAFFVIVMACSGTLMSASAVNMVATTALYHRFPPSYLKTCMIGEGASAILGDVLNIVSVAAFDDISSSTLMYFLFGGFVFTGTLVLSVLISRTTYFNACLNTIPEDLKKGTPKRAEMRRIVGKIKLSIFLIVLMVLGMAMTHTSVTSLVVSEQDSVTSSWAKKFFTPVITFFLADVCSLVGRFLASHSPLANLPDIGFCAIAIVRLIVLVPAIWFCNAQPRDHLSVLFPHDYQYAIILGVFMMITGFFMNMVMFLIMRKTSKEETEMAFLVLITFLGIMTTVSSPFGSLIVGFL